MATTKEKFWCLTRSPKKEISSNWLLGKKIWCLTKVQKKKSLQIVRWEKRTGVLLTSPESKFEKRTLVKLIDGQKVLTSDFRKVWIKKSRQIDRWAQSSDAWQKFEKRNLFKLFDGKKGLVYYLRHLNQKFQKIFLWCLKVKVAYSQKIFLIWIFVQCAMRVKKRTYDLWYP